MDTPQVTAGLLASCLGALRRPGAGALLGPAVDGGWWAIGLRAPDPRVFLGVPMSSPQTARAQRRRLSRLGMAVEELPVLRDVDVWEDALSVPVSPTSRFAATLAAVRADASLVAAP
jgi:glycosyltransferase A (GT-A) superfamily protein (DUF2064 family)